MRTTCPAWCTVDHSDGLTVFHAGDPLQPAQTSPTRLWCLDSPDAAPGVVVAGEYLTPEEASDLGWALVTAVATIRAEEAL